MSRVGPASSPLCLTSFRHSTKIFLLLLLFAATRFVLAQEQVLYRFQGGTDGYHPAGALLKDNAGNLYGVTVEGGTPGRCERLGCGTVFELTPPTQTGDPWTEIVLYRFLGNSDGGAPGAALISDRQGNLYSTSLTGGEHGQGTVFELVQPSSSGGAWTHRVLYSFAGNPSGIGAGDGSLPGGVVFDAAGNLYGTTDQGGFCATSDGITNCFGTVFQLAPPSQPGGAWTESVIHLFGPRNLNNPHGSLILDNHGNLYGTTYTSGISPYIGGVFKLSRPRRGEDKWRETTLFEFDLTDGGAPNGSLIFDTAGNLYGTTLIGGTSGYGTAFELSPPASGSGMWTETVLHNFLTNGDGNSPLANLIFDKCGNLFGTDWWGGEFGEYNAGTVFQLAPPLSSGGEWTETTLHSFGSGDDGSEPTAGLIFGLDGLLYGTASQGGGARTRDCELDGYAWTCGIVFAVKP